MPLATHLAADEAARRAAREAERRAALESEIASGADGASQLESGAARYRDLKARGAVGAERRLDWIRRISQIKEALRLPELDYELAPQQAAAGAAPLPSMKGRYEFRSSAMKLRLGLLHEGDLLGFLDELDKPVSAVPRVRACRIERIADAGAGARLGAECRVDWITLGERP